VQVIRNARIVWAGWVALLVPTLPGAFAQGVYTYVDAQGVKTLTNIPPVGPVANLELSPSAIAQLNEAKPAPPRAASGTAKTAPTRYDGLIDKYASEYQIDASLIRSMIVQESNFNTRAVSRKGAQGLMQLMPGTAARHGVRNVFDPEENIRGGAKHMRTLLDRFNNDVSLSLAAYNAGENLVERIRRVPNIPETRQYVKSVTARYSRSQPAALEQVPPSPQLFRYFDANGVLHLTNIPPVSRGAEASLELAPAMSN
jgi:soluble lytic murein transglycosylase-like protein